MLLGSGTQAPIERDVELGVLHSALQAAVDGHGVTAVVEGAPGIGKTTLIRAVRAHAADDGLQILTARGTELDQALGFGGLRQLFLPVLRGEGRRELAAGPGRVVLSALGLGDEADEPGDPAAVAHGVYWVLADLAERQPLALLVDDLQWLDAASRQVLVHVCSRLEDLQVLAVLATRPEPAVLLELDPVLREPATLELRPRALSAYAVAHLTRAACGDEADADFIAACAEVSGGNPFLLQELLREVRTEHIAPRAEQAAAVREIAPRAVQRMVLVRLARLSEDARRVAQATAVLGPGAEPATVARVANLSPEAARSAIRSLADAQILVREPALDFIHPLTRTATYRDMAPDERAELHTRAAAALREREVPVQEVAVHLLRVGPAADAAAAADLHRAGTGALAAGAVEAARAYLERASREPPPPDRRWAVQADLGRAQVSCGAVEGVETLRAVFDSAPDVDARAGVAVDYAMALSDLEVDGVGAVRALWRVVEDLPEHDDRRLLLLARLVLLGGRFEVTRADGVRATEMIPAGLSGTTMAQRACLAVQACVDLGAGRAERAHEFAMRAVSGTVDTDSAIAAAIALRVCGDLDASIQVLRDVLAREEATGRRAAIAWAMLSLAMTMQRSGDLRDAESLTAAAVPLLSDRAGPDRAFAAGCHGRVLVERGMLDDADEVLRQEFAIAGTDAEHRLITTRAYLAAARGDYEEAVSLFRKLAACVDHVAYFDYPPEMARALAATGRTEEAIAMLDEQLRAARAFGAPAPVGWLTAARGLVLRDPELVRDGVELLRATPFRVARAAAITDLGMVLRLTGRPRDAREHLREGLELAREMGAGTLARRAGDELRAAGGRAVERAARGVEALTPSELRIARLAAEGFNNREIAQRLFLTRKTVEMHLSNSYRKLDITSRTDLAGALS